MVKKILPLLLGIILSFSPLHAEKEITFERITATNGLSSNHVLSICQDRYGFLWIATANGLNRYDGYEFKVYKHQPDDTTSLPSNEVNHVFIDKKGLLWVGTLEGLSCYDRAHDSFINYQPIPENIGAEQQSVISIDEDSQGRLWIGSRWNGLLVFNRQTESFRRMRFATGDMIQNSGNANTGILQSAAGTIYSGFSSEGLLQYNENDTVFKSLPLGERYNREFIDNLISAFHQDKEGVLWFGTLRTGLYRYDIDSAKLTKVPLLNENKVKSLWIKDLYEDELGYLWIASNNGLSRLNLKTMESVQYTYNPQNPSSIPENDIWCIFRDCYGMLWFGTNGGGLAKYNPEKISFQTYTVSREPDGSPDNLGVYSLMQGRDDDQTLWIGSANGLINFNRLTNKYQFTDSIPALKLSLAGNPVNDLYLDESGILWLALNQHGLLKYDINQQKFRQFDPYRPAINGVSSDPIYFIEADDYGKLWIGSRGGLYRFDPHTSEWSLVPSLENRSCDQDLLDFMHTDRFHQDLIGSILQVRDNQDLTEEFTIDEETEVLITSVGEGSLTWDMVDYGWLENTQGDTLFKANKVINSFHLNGDIKNRITAAIKKLPAGKYRLRYISDDSHSYGRYNTEAPPDSQFWGIQVVKISTADARNYASILRRQNDRSYIYGAQINVIEYGSNGILWLGTTRGLSKYELKSKKITNYRHDKDNPHTLSNDIISDIHEDAAGIVWLTTESGLNRFDPRTEEFTAYYENDGLPSAQLMSIEEDHDGNLWIGSINGMCRLERGDADTGNIFINYDTKDGLQGYIFFRHASFINHSGELFFGGRNGLNAFYPGKTNMTPADIVISDFFISNQAVNPISENSPLKKHILDTDHMVLNYDQNDLSFEIAALHFARPERNSLAYRLDGFNDQWVQNPHRFISFTNLAAGDYRFRVRGANSDGIKSDAERMVAITILPPWWQTTWAYIMYVFLFAAVIFSVDRVQRYRLTQRERNRAQIREAELRAQAAEAHAKMIESENKRKTLELEEARKLQLSMLPAKLPQLPHLNIAVFMQTATEVGGDYYDFHVGLDGMLTVVVGDATGHGMKAGTMVTTAKSLFNSYAPNPDIKYSFSEITRCIKQMNLDKLSMCMTMLKIKDRNLLMSSAGMPPIFVYRKEDRLMEEHLIQGMPLGSMEKFPYEIKETTLAPGDTIMLMSDGLAELKNTKDELFGYTRVRNTFEAVADSKPEDIISHLKNEVISWLGDSQPDDDITFVVIQAGNKNTFSQKNLPY